MIKLLQRFWALAALSGVVFYMWKYSASFIEAADTISFKQIFLAIFLALCAKRILTRQMVHSLDFAGVKVTPNEALRLYSYPDISKYIPGGVWGIVGRLAMYRRKALNAKAISIAFGLENFWIVGSAAALGSVLYIISIPSLPFRIPISVAPWAAISFFIIWIGAVAFSLHAAGSNWHGHRLYVILLEQTLIWTCFGGSFYCLAGGDFDFFIVLGAVALSFAAGFIAVFAPAGIGVREVFIVFLLAPVSPPDTTLAIAILYRAVLFLADLLFVAYTWWSSQQEDSVRQ